MREFIPYDFRIGDLIVEECGDDGVECVDLLLLRLDDHVVSFEMVVEFPTEGVEHGFEHGESPLGLGEPGIDLCAVAVLRGGISVVCGGTGARTSLSLGSVLPLLVEESVVHTRLKE